MLSFVPGDVPRNPLPPQTAGDDVLVALARLIRALHEASAGWVPPPDAVWGGTPANPVRPIAERTELVSHCDYYPGNVVFRDGLPVALIDFDLASPGSPLWDVALAARLWVPLRDPRDVEDERAGRMHERLRFFVDAYDLPEADRRRVATAVMQTHGITHILTPNGSDFARYPGVTVLDPAGVPAPPLRQHRDSAAGSSPHRPTTECGSSAPGADAGVGPGYDGGCPTGPSSRPKG